MALDHADLELAAKLNEVAYYITATLTEAIRLTRGPKLIILAGSDLLGQYDLLARSIDDNAVLHLFILGESTELIAALDRIGYAHYTPDAHDLAKVVSDCAAVSDPGDTVILVTSDSKLRQGFITALAQLTE